MIITNNTSCISPLSKAACVVYASRCGLCLRCPSASSGVYIHESLGLCVGRSRMSLLPRSGVRFLWIPSPPPPWSPAGDGFPGRAPLLPSVLFFQPLGASNHRIWRVRVRGEQKPRLMSDISGLHGRWFMTSDRQFRGLRFPLF